MRRLAATPVMRTPAELRAIAPLVGAPHRILTALAGPWLRPTLSDRLPVPSALRALVASLGGRLVVTNPCATARLPPAVGALAHAALRRALAGDVRGGVRGGVLADGSDARDAADRRRLGTLLEHADDATRDALEPGMASWGMAVLFEPDALVVRLDASDPLPAPPMPPALVAEPRFRLLLVAGRGAAPRTAGDAVDLALDRAAAQAGATPWPPAAAPRPWLATRLLVPDAIAVHGMDAPTLAAFARLTGRAGPESRDRYWFAESWERFREPGRRVGHVTPAEVARSRRSHGGLAWGAGPLALNPELERGVCVPPGYCLVDCVGTLEVAAIAL